MKKTFKSCRIICLLLLTIFIAAGFTPLAFAEDSQQADYIPVTGIDTSGFKSKMNVMDLNYLNINVIPSNATDQRLTYNVFMPSRPNIFTIYPDPGLIKANEPGFTLIIVKSVDNPDVSKHIGLSVTYRTNGSEIPYEPEKWNSDPVLNGTNCYNYALNNQCWPVGSNTVRWFLPGTIRNINPEQSIPSSDLDLNGAGIISRVQDDAGINHDLFYFEPIDKVLQCPAGTYKVALAIAPGQDFHWYRQNPDGTWSHKLGKNPVTNTDALGNVIYDPCIAEMDYTSKGGYKYYPNSVKFFAVSGLNNMYTPYTLSADNVFNSHAISYNIS